MNIAMIEAPVHGPAEIEAVMTKLGRETAAGIVVMPDTTAVVYRNMIVSLAERYRLPTIYPLRVPQALELPYADFAPRGARPYGLPDSPAHAPARLAPNH
jgi:hypothetical protein